MTDLSVPAPRDTGPPSAGSYQATVPDRTTVSLDLLGPFSLRLDGATVTISRGSQRLLAFLALRKKTDRRVVAGTLWRDGSEERAGANLRAAIWRLPGRGRGLVTGRTGSLALDPAVQCDVRVFVRRAMELSEGDGAPLSVRDLAGLADVLLPDWDEEWLFVEREWIRQLGLQALDMVAERLTAAGRVSQAVLVALLAVRADPLRESSQRLLISAHEANQNHCLALSQYDNFRTILHRELGIEPSFPRPRVSQALAIQ